ncbi:MAG: hypothetical protein QOC71_580 [Thermoplasmata archaeon]|nr:hypothetical protein [Thermoplasmata archaeon]
MRRLAHVSDLHFGREDPAVVAGLARDIAEMRADLVLVSGDLTQRARRREFAAAAEFLRGLPAPFIAVPGNHDIPLFDVARRATTPFRRFRRFVGPDVVQYGDDEVAVLGLNTAFPFVWKGGLLRRRQLARLAAWSKETGDRCRIVVTHHPFASPSEGTGHSLVRRSGAGIQAMEAARVDLVLTGHHHLVGRSESRAFAVGGPHRLIVVGAGTSTSVRVRGAPNSYNLIHVDDGKFVVEERRWKDGRFHASALQTYPRHPVRLA